MRLLGFVLVMVLAGWALTRAHTAYVDNQLLMAANLLSRNLPIQVDRNTRIDQILTEPGRIIVTRATLATIRHGQVNPFVLTARVRPVMVLFYKSSPGFKLVRDHGITVKYRLHDASGAFLTELVLTPHDL